MELKIPFLFPGIGKVPRKLLFFKEEKSKKTSFVVLKKSLISAVKMLVYVYMKERRFVVGWWLRFMFFGSF